MCWSIVVGFPLLLLSSFAGAGEPPTVARTASPAFLTNDAFVTGLYTDFDLEDTQAVFTFAFSQLAEHVTVYPSEGYYYFRFPMRGLTVRGTFHLAAVRRDEGILGFGYVGEIEDSPHGRYLEMPGRDHDFGPADGLALTALDDFTYACTWKDRTVTFHLHDPGLEPPAPEHMAPDEVHIGNAFDESGLRFHLLFNESIQRLYWILDESRFVPEAMTILGDRVVLGARTRFVFYRDQELGRKLLIGVHAPEVSYNTWYDGPFDQLPDTHVKTGKVEVRRYLAAHTGLDPATLGRFGHFRGQPGRRVPAAPYRFYEDPREFAFVDSLNVESRVELYRALTQETGRELLAYPLAGDPSEPAASGR